MNATRLDLLQDQTPPVAFDNERAGSHDDLFAPLAPLNGALHLLTRHVLSGLPDEARVLCVGVGTGPELLYLAHAFPRWQFTAVEPAAPMLDICRRRVEEEGFTSRCAFHEGYLDSLPASAPFDAATCFLVSQFVVNREERRDLFRQIAARLRPGGHLVSADLTSDLSTPTFDRLFEVWTRMLESCGMSSEQIEKIRLSFGQSVGVLPAQEVGSIIESGGFENPTLFFQAVLIYAWFSTRSDTGAGAALQADEGRQRS